MLICPGIEYVSADNGHAEKMCIATIGGKIFSILNLFKCRRQCC